MPEENRSSRFDDPDIWTAVNLVFAGVSAFAGIAQVAQGYFQSRQPDPKHRLAVEPVERLLDVVHEAIRNTERLIRLIARAENGESVAKAPFAFGSAPVLFERGAFNEYMELVSKIATNVGAMSTFSLLLMQVRQETAVKIAVCINTRIQNVSERIRGLQHNAFSNEYVLEECLDMLRIFERILTELDRQRN